MDPSTGTFISMDSYAGTIYDPVSLHKYLYANANPVMNTDPSGYTSISSFVAGMAANISKVVSEALRNTVVIRAVKSAAAGFVTGAVVGGIDSALSGNEIKQVLQDALKSALMGAGVAAVISVALIYAAVSVPVLVSLHIFNFGMLVSGSYGVLLAKEEGNETLALFRAIMTLTSFVGFSKVLSDIEFIPISEVPESSECIRKVNNPLENIEYTDKVLSQMQKGDYHAFPDSVTAFGDMAKAEQIIGGDGIARMKYEIEGSYFGKDGVFQFIIEPDGFTCNHRLFVPYQ